MNIPRIVTGLELVDDEGDEVVVHKISEAKGVVTLQTSDGDSYSMSLRELRRNLRDGAFAVIDDDDENEDDELDAEDDDTDSDEEEDENEAA